MPASSVLVTRPHADPQAEARERTDGTCSVTTRIPESSWVSVCSAGR